MAKLYLYLLFHMEVKLRLSFYVREEHRWRAWEKFWVEYVGLKGGITGRWRAYNNELLRMKWSWHIVRMEVIEKCVQNFDLDISREETFRA